MRVAVLTLIVIACSVPVTAQEGFSLGLTEMALPLNEPSAAEGDADDIVLEVTGSTREELVYHAAITPKSPKEFSLALWNHPMGRLYYSRAEAESMLGREGLVNGGRMVGLGMSTTALGDQSSSSLEFLASGGSWSELTLGEKFAAGAEASFIAAIIYALASYAD